MSERRSHLARSSLVVMAAFLAAKVVGLLRERVIAHQFGAGADYDAYVAAFKLPDLIFALIAGGALVSAFLPVFGEALARRDDEDAWRIASGMTNLVVAVTTVLALASALAAPWLVRHVVAPGFDVAQQALTVALMRVILVSTLVFAVSGIQMGILNAFQHFLTPAVAPIVYNLGIVAGALWLAPRWGVRGLAWGVVLGSVLHLAVKVPALARHGFRYWPILGFDLPGVRQVLWLMWPRVVGLGTVQVAMLVNVRLASDLATGSLSALNYAWVLAQMPQTLIGTAIGTVVFPTLAEQSALGLRDALRATLTRVVRVMLVLSLPTAAALCILGGPALELLLVTGRFDATAASATLLALRMFAVGLAAHVTLEAVARAFYAQKDTLTPLGVAAGAMALQIALAVALVRGLGQAGLALANSLAVSAEVLVAMWLLRTRLGGIDGRAIAATFLRVGLATLVMSGAMVAVLWLPALRSTSHLGAGALAGLARASIGAVVGALAFAAAASALGVEEIASLRPRRRR